MMRIVNMLLYGFGLGFGIGAAFFELWLISAGCFVATAAGLFLFIRSCLKGGPANGAALHQEH